MKSLIGSFIGLVLSVSVGAESLLEGQVSLSSGQPAAGVQVRLFDLTDLRRFIGTTTDETGHFALPLQTFSTVRGMALPTDFALGQNYPNPFNPSAMEADGSIYGLTVSGEGLVAHVNPTFRVGVDEVDIVVEEYGGARMKRAAGGILGDVDGNGQVDAFDALFVVMYSLDSSIVLPNNGDISRGDVNGDGLVDVADAVLLLRYLSNPSDPALPPGIGQIGPLDLVVVASVSDSTLAFEQPFWLRATVRNQGGGEPEPTVLFYYRSTDATITSDDTQISADVVSLATADLVTKSLSLTAAAEAGTYYYGACVQSVSGEHDTTNNCSNAVRVTVSSEFVSGDIDISAVMDGDYRTWHLPDGAMARLGKGVIDDIAFSPGGQYLAVASGIGVWIYEVATSRALMLISTASSVRSVEFSPDGATLASGAWDGTVKLWDVATGEIIATLEGHGGGVQSVSFSPDGATLASGAGDATVKLWDVATGEPIATLEEHWDVVQSVSFSPDGATLASSGAWDGTVKLWDVASREIITTLEGHGGAVWSASFSPDGATLAWGTWDGTVKLWDVASREIITTLEGHADAVFSVSFSPDGATLASASWDGTVKLWDVATGEIIATLEGHADAVFSVSFSPDGTTLASGAWDSTVKLWDVATHTTIATLQGHTAVVRSVSFSPDGTTLASGEGNAIGLWDVATHTTIATLEGHADAVYSVSFSSDGATLASASRDSTVKLWDVATGEIIATLEGHANWVYSVSFSPDGDTVASASRDSTVKLWDVATRTTIATLQGHAGVVWSVSFSPDGTTLASGSFDGTVRLWDVATHTTIATLQGHADGIRSVSFSPDGTTLASGSFDGTVRLWDVATHTTIATLQGHADQVQSVSFSPDGTTLASASWDGPVRLWDVATHTTIATLEGHADGVTSVSFSSDGTTLASGAYDGTILLWDVAEWTNAGKAVAANKLIGLPDEFQLQQNAPNPFNSQTVLSYFLPKSGPVRLELFSVTGQRVAILHQGPQQAGYHQLRWKAQDDEGRPLASGIYFYRLETTNGILTRKLTLLR